MNKEHELRKAVAQRSRREDIPDAVWNDHTVREEVKAVLEGQDPEFDFLLEAVQDRLVLFDAGRAQGRPEPYGANVLSSGDARARNKPRQRSFDAESFAGEKIRAMACAMSELFAGLAGQHPGVQNFRCGVLGGRLLGDSQARELLSSWAARFLDPAWFERWSIPVVGHKSVLAGEPPRYANRSSKLSVDHRVRIRVDPPGVALKLRYADPRTEPGEEMDDTRCVAQGGAIIPPAEFFPLEVGDPSGRVSTYLHSVWPGSVIHELYDLAKELAETFDWSDVTAAAWFVLTGKAPEVHPLKATFERYQPDAGRYGRVPAPPWRIQLTLPPWLPAEEVARAYRLMQEQIIEKRRLPDVRSLEAARFVWKQQKTHGYKYPPWKLLWERWNEEHSASRFKTYSDFRRYCIRGAGAVFGLNFTAPDPEKRRPQR